MTDTQPADEIRFGRVKATIWMNTTEDGQARYSAVFFTRLPRWGPVEDHAQLRPQ